MGFLYDVECERCGYGLTVQEGAGMSGVVRMRMCLDCREVVAVFEELETLRIERLEQQGFRPGEIERILAEPFEERCPQCASARLKAWGDEHIQDRDDAGRPLEFDPCPKCAGPMASTGAVGIWD